MFLLTEPTVPIEFCTDNQEAFEECCKYDSGSVEYQECCEEYGCCPICDVNGKVFT